MRRLRRLLDAVFLRQRPSTHVTWKRTRDIPIEDRPTVQLQAVNYLLHLEENYNTVPMQAVRPLVPVQQTEPIAVLNMTEHIKAIVEREQ